MNSLVMYALCGILPAYARTDKLVPLTIYQWHQLQQKLDTAQMKPDDLLSCKQWEIQRGLNLSSGQATKITALLEQVATWKVVLDRLAVQGIHGITLADSKYPGKLRRLGIKAPPVLFYAGSLHLVDQRAVAILGAPNPTSGELGFASLLGKRCAKEGLTLVSGCVGGIEATAINHALLSGGEGIMVSATHLSQHIRQKQIRDQIIAGTLVVLSALSATSKFSVARATQRNDYIYALADFPIVAAADYKKGPTWAGTLDCIKQGYCRVFVRQAEKVRSGNPYLLQSGAYPLKDSDLTSNQDIWELLSTIDNLKSSSKPVESLGEMGLSDLYDVVWPYIHKTLGRARSIRDLAHLFNVSQAQMGRWVARAVAEGKIRKIKRPVAYVSIEKTDA